MGNRNIKAVIILLHESPRFSSRRTLCKRRRKDSRTLVLPEFIFSENITSSPVLGLSCSTTVFVCFLPIHSGHQWTYQPGSHRRKVTQEEGHTGFLIHLPSAVRALIFIARRIQPFLSLVDREVEFCVLTN